MFDSIVAYNQGLYVEAFGGYNEQADTVRDYPGGNSLGDGWIRTASMNRHIWYGVISTFEHNFSEKLSFVAGIDARYYVGKHYIEKLRIFLETTLIYQQKISTTHKIILTLNLVPLLGHFLKIHI